MQKFLFLPIVFAGLLAGCANQSPVSPVSTPQDWERWLQIGPTCRYYNQRACLAQSGDDAAPREPLWQVARLLPDPASK
jgi:hypothetical protein